MDLNSQVDRSSGKVPGSLLAAWPSRIGQAPLLFTLRDDCPVRLSAEDLRDPSAFKRRLDEWLLRQG